MKEITLIAVCIILFSCGNQSKENSETSNSSQKAQDQYNVLNDVVLPNYPLWSLNSVSLKRELSTYNGAAVFKIERTSTTETAFALVNNIAVSKDKRYKISVSVRKASDGNLFGLRVVGEYPNRIDAVFDLKRGIETGIIQGGNFPKSLASIKFLGNGWYECSIVVKLNVSRIKIILGPTNEFGKTPAWEAAKKEKCNIQIIPSSLKLEELS